MLDSLLQRFFPAKSAKSDTAATATATMDDDEDWIDLGKRAGGLRPYNSEPAAVRRSYADAVAGRPVSPESEKVRTSAPAN